MNDFPARPPVASGHRSVVAAGSDVPHLLDQGTRSASVAAWREAVRAVIEEAVVPLTAAAERERCFPPAALCELASAGVFRERWSGGGHGDLGRSVVLGEELGRAWLGGVGVGISVHLESVIGILTRFGHGAAASACLEEALDGRIVTCLAGSEDHAGSDLASVRTALTRVAGGWRVRGRKAYVSLGGSADAALVLCRVEGAPARSDDALPPLAVVLVPKEALRVERRLETTGMRSLETVRLSVDAEVDDDALIGRPGRGLLTVSWGLSHERLAAAAQVIGGAQRAVDLTVTHLRRRQQHGSSLFGHQALRLRIAELTAQLDLARRGVYEIAASFSGTDIDMTRVVAGVKVTVARLGERVVRECLHMFGGRGYLQDGTPLDRLSRDLRFARLGGGSDEMMWELVASGLRGDDDAYDGMIAGVS